VAIRGEAIPLTPSWVAVLIALGGAVYGAGQVLFQAKGDYATKADIAICATKSGQDSLFNALKDLSYEVRRMGENQTASISSRNPTSAQRGMIARNR
jgi:hypothetical protein